MTARAVTVMSSPGHRWPWAGVAATLGDQEVERAVRSGEAVRVEPVRVGPQGGIVVLAVEVEQDQGALRDVLAPPGQVAGREASHEGGERVEAPHLVGERDGVAAVGAGAQQFAVVGPAVQGVGGEGGEPGDRDRGPHDVQQFDGGDPRVEEIAVGVTVPGHGAECGSLGYRVGPRCADVGDQFREGLLLPGPGPVGADVARPGGREAVHHGRAVTGQVRDRCVG